MIEFLRSFYRPVQFIDIAKQISTGLEEGSIALHPDESFEKNDLRFANAPEKKDEIYHVDSIPTSKGSSSDPISDMLTCIRSAQAANIVRVSMPSSRTKVGIASVLKDEGYITDFRVDENDGKPNLEVTLKYFEGRGVIDSIKRASRPGLRVYRGKDDLPRVLGEVGIAIVKTSQGFMTERKASKTGMKGKVIAYVAGQKAS